MPRRLKKGEKRGKKGDGKKGKKGGQPDLPYFLGARVNFLLLTKK
jgi:hypothetical protein